MTFYFKLKLLEKYFFTTFTYYQRFIVSISKNHHFYFTKLKTLSSFLAWNSGVAVDMENIIFSWSFRSLCTNVNNKSFAKLSADVNYK